MGSEPIIAIALLTKNDVRLLDPSFDRLWPVEESSRFNDLLEAIDRADRDHAQDRKAED